MHEPCADYSPEHATGKLRSVAPQSDFITDTGATLVTHSEVTDGNQLGPRKLVRPKLPLRVSRDRNSGWRGESPMLSHQAPASLAPFGCESSNAECFYFQKQMQTQTLMVFVLEDGEHIEGYIEWYDRNAVKIRNGSRTLIYKSAIKYLYKAGDVQSSFDGLKRVR